MVNLKKSSKNLKKEADDFNSIYKKRFHNLKSILINKDKRVEDYFIKNPWRYEFSRNYAFGGIIRDFKQFKKNRGSSLHILDVGCGNGWFSLNANGDNRDYWDCIDISKEAIKTANKFKKELKITKNEYHLKSLEDFSSNEEYDIVSCVHTLHHFTDLDVFYKKVRMYLKKEGMIFIQDVSPEQFSETNAGFVLLIKEILKLTDNIRFVPDSKALGLSARLQHTIYEWRNETDNLAQSHHDHWHSSKRILAFLRKRFIEVFYKETGGMMMRLLGGLRGEMPRLERMAQQLIALEKLLLDRKIIKPYGYTFIGKIKINHFRGDGHDRIQKNK
ncbi:MAG: class I SAM-dependent methyltransferase [Candidatus Omnitrophota bacterium]